MRDAEFQLIAQSLNIAPDLVKKLTETEDDTDLLLEQVAKKIIFNKPQLVALSPEIASKLLIFKYSPEELPIKEKMYVARAITEFYPLMATRTKTGSLDRVVAIFTSQPSNENTSRYLMVAVGFMSQFMKTNINDRKYINIIESGFRLANLRDLSRRVIDWVIILKRIRNDGWLDNTEPKLLIAPPTLKKSVKIPVR